MGTVQHRRAWPCPRLVQPRGWRQEQDTSPHAARPSPWEAVAIGWDSHHTSKRWELAEMVFLGSWGQILGVLWKMVQAQHRATRDTCLNLSFSC